MKKGEVWHSDQRIDLGLTEKKIDDHLDDLFGEVAEVKHETCKHCQRQKNLGEKCWWCGRIK